MPFSSVYNNKLPKLTFFLKKISKLNSQSRSQGLHHHCSNVVIDKTLGTRLIHSLQFAVLFPSIKRELQICSEENLSIFSRTVYTSDIGLLRSFKGLLSSATRHFIFMQIYAAVYWLRPASAAFSLATKWN